MNSIVEIVKLLEKTSSTKEKQNILNTNKDNEVLKKVLYYTYNDNMYGVTRDTIKRNTNPSSQPMYDIFSLLDCLTQSNINDSLRQVVNDHLGMISEEVAELYIRILTKDLRCGVSKKTIQKVFPNLLPQFGCMLANKYSDYEGYVEGKDFTLTMKMDGLRNIAIKDGDKIESWTRQHKQYEGLTEIMDELKTIEGDFVLDGELMVCNYKEIAPETRYKLTTNIVRKDGDKKGVVLIVFDIIPIADFYKGKSDIPYEKRRAKLESLFSKTKFIIPVEKVYEGRDTSVIMPLLDKYTSIGEEGLMLNINSSPYECKRTKELLKLKKMQTCDVKVIDIYEGTGQNEGKLGGIVIQFKNNDGEVCECSCGSGFSQEEREKYWQNKDLLIGKIVELKYFEVTKNQNGGYGLRFPIWIGRIRDDKTDISMN